jgi:hypothetical protein
MGENSTDPQHLVLLGQIKGTQDAHSDLLQAQGNLLQSIDARLRNTEQATTKAAAVSGGVVAVGMALLIEGFKGWIKGPGANS